MTHTKMLKQTKAYLDRLKFGDRRARGAYRKTEAKIRKCNAQLKREVKRLGA